MIIIDTMHLGNGKKDILLEAENEAEFKSLKTLLKENQVSYIVKSETLFEIEILGINKNDFETLTEERE